MNIEDFRDFCLSKVGSAEDLPFGEDTLVFKLKGKMFALTQIENFESITLKCEPQRAVELKEKFPSVLPAYHMNKKHWITVKVNAGLSDDFVFELTNQSYDQVLKNLTLKLQNELKSK